MIDARIKHIFLAGTFLTAAAVPAFALDGADVMSKFKAVYEQQSGLSITYSDIKKDGDNSLVVSGIVLQPTEDMDQTLEGLKQKEPLTLTLDNITENADGSYIIGKSSVSDATFMAKDIDLTIGSLVETNLHIPADASADGFAGWSYAEGSEAQNITLSYMNEQVLTIDSANSTQTFDDSQKQLSYLGSADGITLDLTNVSDISPDVRDILEKLNLLKTNSNVSASGLWNGTTGDMKISSYDLSVEDVGTLSTNLALTGLTIDTIEKLQELSNMPEPAPEQGDDDDQAATSPYTAGLMEAGQKIGISNFSISFNDDSITARVLKLLGDQQGISAADAATKIENDLGASLKTLNMPDLSKMATSAVSAFLADPQNITISIEPQMKMPVLAVMMAGAAAPQSVPQLLNLKITANQ